MVIERFKNRDAQAMYRRFREKGRMAPAGLAYVESWVDQLRSLFPADGVRRSALLGKWAGHWRDLVEFEFFSGAAFERCGRHYYVGSLNYDFTRQWWVPRSLLSKDASFGRSCSFRAINFKPSPTPDLAWRTMASARICPSCTRKCNLIRTPSALGRGDSRNNPPMLMSRTLDTSSRPWHCQYTQTSPGAGTREVNLLEGEVDRKRGLPGTMV
jgi:Domain of unknown function (DUF3303)